MTMLCDDPPPLNPKDPNPAKSSANAVEAVIPRHGSFLKVEVIGTTIGDYIGATIRIHSSIPY